MGCIEHELGDAYEACEETLSPGAFRSAWEDLEGLSPEAVLDHAEGVIR